LQSIQVEFSLGKSIAEQVSLFAVTLWCVVSLSLGGVSAMMANPTSDQWSVTVDQTGRSGSIAYKEPSGSISFYWEFGGGDTVAIIWLPKSPEWSSRYPWAVERRRQILERVAREVVRQKAPTCKADIDEQQGYMYIREQPGGQNR
jgi:hypothetical protein